MKYLLIVVLLWSVEACDQSTSDYPKENSGAGQEDQPLEDSTTNTQDSITSQESGQNTEVQQSANPGEIIFSIKIIEGYPTAKDICGISKPHVFLAEIVEVIQRGQGITHMPHKKERLLVNFFPGPKNLEAATTLKAKARESLCPDGAKTYFTINSYEILE